MKTVTVTAPVDPDVRTQRVSYRDLNLTLAGHQKVLNGRVGKAVRFVCEPVIDAEGLSLGYSACRSEAWRGARPQIALAIRRASEIASTGSSAIPPVAITLAFPSR